jgi:hypothetical protein
MKLQKKVLAAIAVLALAVPAIAAAAIKNGSYVAPKHAVQSGYDLKFKVKNGRITKLVARVLEYCDGSAYSDITTIAPDSSWKISKSGKFSGRHKEKYKRLTLYYTLEGKITKTKAVGKVRQESVITGSTCDTHKLKFTAKRK